MYKIEVTSLSSKGQVVIPNRIRQELKMSTGTKFVVLTEGGNLLLKPIISPKLATFKKLINQSRKIALEQGLSPNELPSLIRRARREGRS
jgi:AbrB family looped-hinge helix DNA binding protein